MNRREWIAYAVLAVFVVAGILFAAREAAVSTPPPTSSIELVDQGSDVRVYRDKKRKVVCWEFARGVWCENEYVIEERERWEKEQSGH